jgi:flagellar motility protein MotE (MotC chaperone)
VEGVDVNATIKSLSEVVENMRQVANELRNEKESCVNERTQLDKLLNSEKAQKLIEAVEFLKKFNSEK